MQQQNLNTFRGTQFPEELTPINGRQNINTFVQQRFPIVC